MIDRRRVLRYTALAKERARELRQHPTPGEKVLWRSLRGSAIKGYDFHRQKPIGDFIVDFFCARLMLAIELDGRSHWFRTKKDKARQKWLEGLGVQFLRFSEDSVRKDPRAALREIERWIEEQEESEGAS